MKSVVPIISISLMILLGVGAYWGNVWFESEFNNAEDVNIPHEIVSGPDTSGVDGKPILTPIEGGLTDGSSGTKPQATPVPTVQPTPTPDDYVVLPTSTPAQQASSTIITFMFDKAPVDPAAANPNSKAVFCSNGNTAAIDAIENNAKSELLSINSELDSCRATVENEATACLDACGTNFACFESCGVTGGAQEAVCEQAYHTSRDPIVSKYLGEVTSLCTIL